MADKPKGSDKSQEKPNAPDPKRPILKVREAVTDSIRMAGSKDSGKGKPRRKR